MSLLLPLGLLGLLGLVALLLIYLIKPNYQNQSVSSTFVWKLSLKYKKKKLPISKIRNLLLLFCQILIIVACAFLLAHPVVPASATPTGGETVIVLDASASMRAKNSDGETRFERAVNEMKNCANAAFDEQKTVSAVLAGTSAEFIFRRIAPAQRDVVSSRLDMLLNGDTVCTYGSADVDGAMALAQSITLSNPNAEVVFVTGTSYENSGDVRVINVAENDEWNVAILNCYTEVQDNFFSFFVDIACFGASKNVVLNYTIAGTNADKSDIRESISVNLIKDTVMTVQLHNVPPLEDGEEDNDGGDISKRRVYSYSYVSVRVQEDDAISDDNIFYLYAGEKPTIRVQYASTVSNSFFSSVLYGLNDILSARKSLDIVEIRNYTSGGDAQQPATEGFDFYIFEGGIPQVLPNDGVVMIVDPRGMSVPWLGATFGNSTGDGSTMQPLTAGASHPITSLVTVPNIEVSLYRPITVSDSGYTELMYCNGDTVIACKNDDDAKIVLMSFSLNYSNFSMLVDYPIFMYNIFEYYMPSTFDRYVYDVNDTITINARTTSATLTVVDDEPMIMSEIPYSLTATRVGRYSVRQNLISGNTLVENFYVKIPTQESNITKRLGVLRNPEYLDKPAPVDYSLLVYFAAVLFALTFAEWLLYQYSRGM